MNLNENIRAQMRAATRLLMSDGIGAATAAIQKALKGSDPAGTPVDAPPRPVMPDEAARGNSKGMPDFVTDLLERLGVKSRPGGETVDRPLADRDAQPVDAPASGLPSGARFLAKSYTNHAGTRAYKVYIPSSYHGQAMPVMVMLHGCTQNPDDFAVGTQMNAVAEQKNCFVVYPAQSKSGNPSQCWNWFTGADQKRDSGEPSIIAGITREVIGQYHLDAKQVYVAGLSAGGAMAIIMGTNYPDLYAAVGVHSGLPYGAAHDLPSALAAMRGGAAGATQGRQNAIPIIVFHGDHDTTVNVSNGAHLMKQNVRAEQGTAGSGINRMASNVIVEDGQVQNGHRYTRTSHHDQSGRSNAEHWVIHGAGHAWAGGNRKGSYTDAKGPDASTEMLRFFYRHSLA